MNYRITIFSLGLLALFLVGCSSDSVNEKLNKAGNMAGKAAGELIDGASKGVESAFDIKLEVSQTLKEKGVEIGKTTLTSGEQGTDNLFVAYVIFHKDFKGAITAKAFDEKGLEMGRVKMDVDGKKDEAHYVDFQFDKRTNLDAKSSIVLE